MGHGMDYSTLVDHIRADNLDDQLLPAASFPEDVTSLPIPFQIFKTLVDAGSDLNSCSKSSGKPSVNKDRTHATSVHALVCVDIHALLKYKCGQRDDGGHECIVI